MHFSTPLTALATTLTLLTTHAATASTMHFQNNCGYSVYASLTRTDSATEYPAGSVTYSQPITTTGQSFFIAKDKSAGSQGTASVTFDFQQQQAANRNVYDIFLGNGDPFHADGYGVITGKGSCPTIECSPGQDCPATNNEDNYCDVDADVIF